MKAYFNEHSTVVSYKESNATKVIQDFRDSDNKWIISVGMISEGTNIPRLQVCCHLTNIKTEMHFRQTLGRILRATDSSNQEAFLFMPAEPKLLDYAYRVKQDVPFEADIVKLDTMKSDAANRMNDGMIIIESSSSPAPSSNAEIKVEEFDSELSSVENKRSKEISDTDHLTSSYEQMLNIFGHFKQETITLGLSDLINP